MRQVGNQASSVSNICSSPGVKRSEYEANHSFPPGADFKTDVNRTSSATYVRLRGIRGDFTGTVLAN